jgi:hypothetical protein
MDFYAFLYMLFPQYRRLANHRSYYRVDAPDEMLEVQVMGSKYWVYHHVARILPEQWLLRDVIDCADGRWEPVSSTEFELFYEDCRQSRALAGSEQ